MIKHLKQYPKLNIQQVADKTGIDRIVLRDSQLMVTKTHIKRDSPLWGEDGESVKINGKI